MVITQNILNIQNTAKGRNKFAPLCYYYYKAGKTKLTANNKGFKDYYFTFRVNPH